MLGRRILLLPIVLFALPLSSCDFLDSLQNPQTDVKDSTGSHEEVHTHTYSTEWSHDKVGHWHQATCEHTSLTADYAVHTYNDQGVCICGAIKLVDPEPLDAVIKVNGLEVSLAHPAYFNDDVVMCDVAEISPYLGVTRTEYSADGKLFSAEKDNLLIFVVKNENQFGVNDVGSLTSYNHSLKKPVIETDYGFDISVDDYADAFGYTCVLTSNILSLTSN